MDTYFPVSQAEICNYHFSMSLRHLLMATFAMTTRIDTKKKRTVHFSLTGVNELRASIS